jgi:hypothetical protein
MQASESRECHTDLIITDAELRGVRHISWGDLMRETDQEVERIFSEYHDRDHYPQRLAELQNQQHLLREQARKWVQQVGFEPDQPDPRGWTKPDPTHSYAITILVEQVQE